MALRIGSTPIASAYLGSTAVARVYLGTALVWGSDGEPSTLKPGTLTNPGLGMLLNWDGPDAVNNNPFLDWLKLGSEWQTSGATAMDWAALLSAGHITANGAINSIPAGADNIRMRLLSQIPSGPATGRYRLYFTGDGSIGFSGAGAVDWPAAGRAEFDYTANGSSFVDLLVSGVTSQITFNALVHEDDWAAYEAGEMFRPAWLDLIRNMRVIRFTDWMATDYRTGAATWATRYAPGRITYQGGEGVPVEVMCRLCNEIGADPWFSLLSGVNDAYVTAFATAVRTALGADRHVYVELSNKIWDGANWPTANYFRDLALAWFSDGGIEACMEAYGGRSSEVFDAWRAVWAGADAVRVHTVLQGWTPNAYISEFAMTAPRWVALQSGRAAPYTKATEWALHANLDGGMRYEDDEHPNVITTIQGWIDTLTDAQIFDNMAGAMRNGNASIGPGYTMSGLATAYTDQKNLLAYYGGTLNPICYEGGSHLAVPPSRNGNSTWIDLFNRFYRSAQWADVWSDSITETWYGAFGAASFYVRKNDIRLPDANNGYGLLRWPGDTAGNLQLAEWESLQAARTGATGRGANDFVGSYDMTEGEAHPLQSYYDSGTIGIHHSTEVATPAGGPVTALTNQGGAGATFNATVSGTAIPLSGDYLQMSASSGMPTMATPADLIGVRLMWAMQIGAYVNGTRLFGGAASSPYGFEVRINSNGSGQLMQLWSNATGTAVTANMGTRGAWPTAAALFEIEIGATSATAYLNGVSLGSGSHAWAQFLVENLGKGQVAGSVPMEGLMGDVLGVLTGRADTAAAIAAARAYLADRFGVTL